MSAVVIYALTDPRDGAIRYVGKANNAAKRLKGHLRDARRRKTPVYNWINKLTRLGMSPGLAVLAACTDDDWRDHERRLIAEHRLGGRLLNVADGGDQPHCPVETLRANARFANDPAIRSFRTAVRRMAAAVRFHTLGGNAEKVAFFQAHVDWLRTFTKAQRVEFSRRYDLAYGPLRG